MAASVLLAGCQPATEPTPPAPDATAASAQAIVDAVLGATTPDLTATFEADNDRIATAIAATLTAAADGGADSAPALTATAAAEETRLAAIVQAALTAAAQAPSDPLSPAAPAADGLPAASGTTPGAPAAVTLTLTPTGTPTPTATATPSATRTPSATPTPSPAIDPGRMETAVAATLTALAPPHTWTPTVTQTPTPSPTATPTPDVVRCVVLADSLNLRSGPGVVYEALAVLARSAELLPLARSDNGWLEIRVAAGGQTGWVTGDSGLVQCSGAVERLPLGIAPPPPTLPPPPTFTPTPPPPAPPPAAEPLQVQVYGSTGAPYYAVAGGGPGSRVYSDRDYVYAEAPALSNAFYILTANADRERREGEMTVTLSVNKPVQVYVAHSDAFAQRPAWLGAFADTGLDARFVDAMGRTATLSLYRAFFPAGEIVLGANAPAGGESHTMYTVIVADAGP